MAILHIHAILSLKYSSKQPRHCSSVGLLFEVISSDYTVIVQATTVLHRELLV